MYRLTERRKAMARDVLDASTRQLHDTGAIFVSRLERDLRELWDVGYQELKGIMIDVVTGHPEYANLS